MSADKAKNFYITTPIYYANDRPHIGHAYTTILADVLTRFHKLLGYNTFFLTGTDEHGQKVQQAAAKRGVHPKAHVDEFHVRFKDLWQKLNIEYDRFIRTTDADHVRYVQQSLQELYDRGEIYEETYAGWYSVSEERFFSDDELVDGKDPISGRPVEWLEEKNYFFKMGSYQDRLIKHIEDNPDFIQPEFRRNEVLGFLRQPLQDLCISRPKSRLEWGIPLPFDQDFVTYVWFDALLNYESGVLDKTFPDGSKAWPANFHVIGKDILTTHSVYWPTMLMGMGRTLPRHILAHGWWLAQSPAAKAGSGEKMSKTTGNVIDPDSYADQYGTDTVRYFLMRDMVLGQDATWSHDLFVSRTNTDLANDLGNAINRVNKFVLTNFEGKLTKPVATVGKAEVELRELAVAAKTKCIELVESMKLSFALEEVAGLVRGVNRYLEQRAPWQMAKRLKEAAPGDGDAVLKAELGTVLFHAAEALRLALCLLHPVMPQKTVAGLAMLGQDRAPVRNDLEWGVLNGGESLAKKDALFPRIQEDTPEDKSADAAKKHKGEGKAQPAAGDPASKLDLRVARIVEVADHPEADALYVLKIQTGRDERTVCAGLKQSYTPEELRDRHVVLFANLKPAKLRGIESAGMLLAADGADGKARLLNPGEIPVGTTLHFGNIAVVPKAKASIKDYQKLDVKTAAGHVMYGDLQLGFHGEYVCVDAPDGVAVK